MKANPCCGNTGSHGENGREFCDSCGQEQLATLQGEAALRQLASALPGGGDVVDTGGGCLCVLTATFHHQRPENLAMITEGEEDGVQWNVSVWSSMEAWQANEDHIGYHKFADLRSLIAFLQGEGGVS